MNGQTNANPFASWQTMMNDWAKAFASPAAATNANPFDAWREAFSRVTGMAGAANPMADAAGAWQKWAEAMTPGAGANPLTAWQEAAKAWTQPQGGAPPAAAFELWFSTFQKWAEQSANFLNMGKPSMEFGLFNPFQGFNPFQTFTPYQLWQQLLQEYLNAWTDFQAKHAGAAPTSDVFRDAERGWLSRLDSTGQQLAATMSTEEFARTLGTSLEQSLAAEQRFLKSTEDQVNSFLRFFHIPSRSQVERLFQRVIAIEERLDDAEDRNRALLKELKAAVTRLEALAEQAAAAAGSGATSV